jgi:uncharacterized protein (DUF58 family)
MPATRADLLQPTDLAALGSVELTTRWVVEGFLAGLHRSPRKGFSVEFAEHRPYQPGDDLRYLDWRILARANRLVIKQYEEETNARAAVVLDVSASMQWRGDPGRLTKLDYATRMAAASAHLLLRQRDAVALVRVGADIVDVLPPRSNRTQMTRIVNALASPLPATSPSAGGTPSNLALGLARAAGLAGRAGFVLLISDLLVEPDALLQQVSGLRALGHDVIVLHVLDPAERDFVADGDGIFVDPESSATVSASAREVREEYQAVVARAIVDWKTGCARRGARYAMTMTDEPFGSPLRRVFLSTRGPL